MTVLHDLARFGPDQAVTLPPAEARAYCRRLATSHYENFSVASLLLPRRLVPHFHHVYAFCRWADDLGDETGDRGTELLAWWRDELRRCYAGEPRHPVMVALAETVAAFRIPAEPFENLITAFERDQTTTRHADVASLLDYCQHSADPVGRIVLHLCDAATPENVALSDAICTGLQLANFWQDVARDFAIGRVYLPQDRMAAHGVSEADIAAKRFTPGFAALMRELVADARERFRVGRPLVERVPADMRMQIDLFRRGGEAILSAIERQGYNVLARRPRLSKLAKVGLVLRTFARHRLGIGS